MPNTITVKENRVVKTFGSRMSYVKEAGIYDKVKGLGLAPELTGNWDGAIEHEYIEGESFEEVIQKSMSDPYAFIKYTQLFLDWYKIFRENVKMSLGDMDFSDFILSEDKLYCIDFEHCKPATIEKDIANLAAAVCLIDKSYTRIGLENAKIFVKNAYEQLDMLSERLYTSVKTAMEEKCRELGIASMNAANEYLASFVSCTFVHTPDYGSELSTVTDALGRSKHMWTLFADDVNLASEKQIRALMSTEKDSCDVVCFADNKKMLPFPLLVRTEGAAIALKTADSRKKFEAVIISSFRCKALDINTI